MPFQSIRPVRVYGFGESGVITRDFRTFDPVVGTYAEIPQWAATGDFEIEFDLVSTNAFKDMALVDNSDLSGLGKVLLYIDNPNGLDLLIGNGSGFNRITFGGQLNIISGDLNTVRVVRVSNVITAQLNGTQIGGSLTYSGIVIITGFIGGGASSVRYFDGIISRVKLTDYIDGDNREYDDFSRSDLVIPDSISGQNGTLYNAAVGSVETYTLDTDTVPNQWVGNDSGTIIPILGS